MNTCGVHNPTTDFTCIMIYAYNNFFSDGPYQSRLSERNHIVRDDLWLHFYFTNPFGELLSIAQNLIRAYALDSRDLFTSPSRSLTLSVSLSFSLTLFIWFENFLQTQHSTVLCLMIRIAPTMGFTRDKYRENIWLCALNFKIGRTRSKVRLIQSWVDVISGKLDM